MTRENFLFGIIGVLLGFILGFMLHGVMSQRDAERAAVSTQQRPQLPTDHPPIDNAGGADQQQSMEQVQQTIARARNDPKDFDAQRAAALARIIATVDRSSLSISHVALFSVVGSTHAARVLCNPEECVPPESNAKDADAATQGCLHVTECASSAG